MLEQYFYHKCVTRSIFLERKKPFYTRMVIAYLFVVCTGKCKYAILSMVGLSGRGKLFLTVFTSYTRTKCINIAVEPRRLTRALHSVVVPKCRRRRQLFYELFYGTGVSSLSLPSASTYIRNRYNMCVAGHGS